jgi:hypothetical protein
VNRKSVRKATTLPRRPRTRIFHASIKRSRRKAKREDVAVAAGVVAVVADVAIARKATARLCPANLPIGSQPVAVRLRKIARRHTFPMHGRR